MNAQDRKKLKDHAILGEISAQARKELLQTASIEEFPASSRLFRQGETAEFLHIMLDGCVALVGSYDEKDETIVEFFRRGDSFIMPAIMLELPYLMSARTVEESRILLIPASHFRRCLQKENALSLAVGKELARHWRLLTRQVKDLKLRSAPQRLGSYLLSLSAGDTSRAEVELPDPRGMLAVKLGMTPENLSRAFSRLQESGVQSRGRRVTLNDIPALREFCAYDDLS